MDYRRLVKPSRSACPFTEIDCCYTPSRSLSSYPTRRRQASARRDSPRPRLLFLVPPTEFVFRFFRLQGPSFLPARTPPTGLCFHFFAPPQCSFARPLALLPQGIRRANRREIYLEPRSVFRSVFSLSLASRPSLPVSPHLLTT